MITNKQTILSMIKPQVRLIKYLEDSPRIIASAGKQTLSPKEFREIYNKMTEDKIEKWIMELVRRGHGSPLEHSLYFFEITCSRVASHQLIRHRIASYTQLSQRYNDKYLRKLVKRIANILGLNIPEKPHTRGDYAVYYEVINRYLLDEHEFYELLSIVGEAFIIPPMIINRSDKGFLESLIRSIGEYYRLLSIGIPYEDSRFILPQSIKTKIVVSMNARELLENFLPLRMCSHAQWEIRYIAWQLWKQLVRIHPSIFKYAGPRCVLMENRIRPEPCSLSEYINSKCVFTITRCPELIPRRNILDCLRYASLDPWERIKGDLGDDTK
jgi:thymidylate synthase (FAD)